MRARLSDEEQRRLTLTAGNLASFSKHPAWPDLIVAIATREEKLRAAIVADALNRSKPVNQREIDYRHGFIQGMRYMVRVCEGAENRLETFLKDMAAPAEDEGSNAT